MEEESSLEDTDWIEVKFIYTYIGNIYYNDIVVLFIWMVFNPVYMIKLLLTHAHNEIGSWPTHPMGLPLEQLNSSFIYGLIYWQ